MASETECFNHYEQIMAGIDCEFASEMGHFNTYEHMVAGNDCKFASEITVMRANLLSR